jgi:hypothetical protein
LFGRQVGISSLFDRSAIYVKDADILLFPRLGAESAIERLRILPGQLRYGTDAQEIEITPDCRPY